MTRNANSTTVPAFLITVCATAYSPAATHKSNVSVMADNIQNASPAAGRAWAEAVADAYLLTRSA